MTRTIFFLLTLIMLLTVACKIKETKNSAQQMDNFNYEQAWQKVSELEKQGLAKTVFKKVLEIYEQAKKAQNGEQIIKSLVYQGKYFVTVEEDGLIKTLERIETDLEIISQPEKSILQSMLAELYDTYLTQQLWKIGNRIPNGDQTETDIRNWTAKQFVDKSTMLYLASVSHEKLDKFNADEFSELFPEKKGAVDYRSSLLDILGHRAIDYFSQGKAFLSQSPDRFILNDPELFAPHKDFLKMDLSGKSPSRELSVLNLFQQLLEHKLSSKDKDATLDLEINRLQYIRRNFIGTNTDEIYEEALHQLKANFKELEGRAEVNYYLAELYLNKGKQHKSEKDDIADYFQQSHDLCTESIDEYPGSYGAELCKGLLSRLENKQLSVKTELVNLPNEHLISLIDYKNIAEIYYKVVVLERKRYEDLSALKKDKASRFIENLTVLQSERQELPASRDFRQHSVEISMDPLEKGGYALVVSDNPEFDPDKGIMQIAPFFVSRLAFWHTNTADQNLIYVADRLSGEPLEGVSVKLFQWNYNRRERIRELYKELITDQNGAVSFSNQGSSGYNYAVELKTKDDEIYDENNLYAGNYRGSDRLKEKVLFFLDRAIYRPGQTVHFKALLIKENGNKNPEIIPFRAGINVQLNDVNRQKIEELNLSTNEFGTLSGSFQLPETGLTGQFSLFTNTSRDRAYFRVEEYKRPKFHVELKEYESSYKLGDKIELDGKALTYGGINISNAKVVYRVMRKSYFPFWSYYMRPNPYNTQQIEIANGITETDGQGNFTLAVELLADDQIPGTYRPYFQYEIQAEVTDPTGETHSDRMFIQAGWSDLDIRLNSQREYHKDSLVNLEVIANNWNGKAQAFLASLKIHELEAPNQVFRKRFWAIPDQWIYEEDDYKKKLPYYSFKDQENPATWTERKKVQEQKVDTEKKQEYKFELPVGNYKVVLEYKNDENKTERVEKFIAVFSDERLAAMQEFKVVTEGGEPGQKAIIDLQTVENNMPVLMEVFDKDDRSLVSWKRPNTKERLSIPIVEGHRGNFHIRTTYLRNNRFHTHTKTIEVPWTNKELDFEYMSFRDQLVPGAEEKWIIKVTGSKKDIILSEMLATMYDASLDDISMHNWMANIYRNNYMKSSIHYFGFGQSRTRSFIDRNWNDYYYPGKTKQYKTLNWFGLEHIPGYRVYREDVGVVESAPPQTRERMMSKRVASGGAEPEAEMDAVMVQSNAVESEESSDESTETNENQIEDGKEKNQSLRTNLNETVFFYPHLKTDEKGNVLIEFTMNEALTSWKFMGLAHSKDLRIGITTKEVVTRKDLMIRPNAPRFTRLGDQLEFSASVSNLSEKALTGTASITLYDALTQKEVTGNFLKGEEKQEFEVATDGNIALTWSMEIPDDSPDLIEYRVIASSGVHSDGEAGYIPVLSNRVMVTETLPMWIASNESKEYRFKALDKMTDEGLKSHRFTLESTSNPVWYAIQAMPYISDYSNGNSIQLVNALYANLLADKIIKENPVIERVFMKWKEEAKLQEGSLQSNLQRNEELKGILLKETPWLLEGLDEATQKKNIALLFDLNKVRQDKSQIMRLLKSLQRHDGGFSWFSGGRSSEYLTLYVLSTVGKLQSMGVDIKTEAGMNNMISQGMRYCDEQISKRYNKLIEKGSPDPEKDYLGSMDILYLYTRSIFRDLKLSETAREANVFYLNQAENHFLKKGLSLQALIALTLNNNGNSTVAIKILNALEETSIFKEELGRYWKQLNGYHWSEFPIETQALLVEAFHSITKNDRLVNEMQIWLLKHKQTNRWKTARASIAAIHALMLNNQKLLQDSDPLKVVLGGTVVKPQEDGEFYETGTGYFKKTWGKSEIDAGMKNITLDNPNDHIAWGAAYWQYFQDIDKVKGFEDTPLTIQKSLYRSVNVKDGEKLEKLENKEVIEPGTKVVVRLRIEVDRQMDFVRLDDRRAAAFEPLNQLSGYKYTGGLFYYEAPGDTGTSFYIEHLARGVYIIEYPLRAVHSGEYINGLATIQSMYAPEFSSHSSGSKVVID